MEIPYPGEFISGKRVCVEEFREEGTRIRATRADARVNLPSSDGLRPVNSGLPG